MRYIITSKYKQLQYIHLTMNKKNFNPKFRDTYKTTLALISKATQVFSVKLSSLKQNSFAI